jgi:hypothetical protein
MVSTISQVTKKSPKHYPADIANDFSPSQPASCLRPDGTVNHGWRRHIMKALFYRGMLTAAAACLSIGSASFAQAQLCSDASLQGKYGQSIAGEFLGAPGGAVPQNGVAMTDFDGHGGLTQVDYVVIGGSPTGPGFQSETGTYSVNSDCTGTLTFEYSDGTQITLQFVVVNHGNEFHTVVSKLVLGGKIQSVNIASVGVRLGDAGRR